MRARLRQTLSPLAGEDGFTLIEVLVAALVLTLAAAATFGVLAAATRNAQRAQATQVALDKAQAEIEKLHTLSYEELALTTTPERVSAPLNPNNRVLNGEFDLKRGPVTEYAPMVVNGGELWSKESESKEYVEGGVVVPGPIPFEEGNVKGELYRYIVWRNDPSCPQSVDEAEDFCPGPQDYKQIVVAAKFSSAENVTGQQGYVEVQSKVANPEAISQPATGAEPPGGNPGGGLGTGKAVTAQQFFLTDTPCSTGNLTPREAIAGDHLVHNTLGNCAVGPKTGSKEPGAPDALLLGAPPDPAPEDEANPLVYDYSSDSYLHSDTDKGLQLLAEDTSGCHWDTSKGANPEAKQHRWVSDPMPSKFKLNGLVTLELYAEAVSELGGPGRICAFLFIRHDTSATEWTDSRINNPELGGAEYWTWAWQGSTPVPRTWSPLRLPMKFPAMEIEVGDRIGIAISVEPAGTPEGAIEFMYDHPDYPSRLEVDTTTPLERG
ncbi:MAG TPA: prepilin-type N-terminal cleavage/methylation domain-containing protein [Solirubrobacterales bacterium]|nr:prepilin-type N-terminal cleavage/methylation domain-containing protein [Solirubrobacterales bacterium]